MSKWINKKRNKKGFTLIELVVVIAILGILAAIAIPRLSDSRDTAAKSSHNANVRTLESAANLYLAENGLPAADMDAEASKNAVDDYVQAWPKTPLAIDEVVKGTDYAITISSTGQIVVTPGAVSLD